MGTVGHGGSQAGARVNSILRGEQTSHPPAPDRPLPTIVCRW